MSLDINIPLAAIATALPGAGRSPNASLARSSAILGPIPPSAPLRLADAALAIADLLPFSTTTEPVAARPRARALIVTGPRALWHATLEDEDEPYLRSTRGGAAGYAARGRLARTETRYCPTAAHAKLLLTLLTAAGRDKDKDASAHQVPCPPPSVVVLYDLLGLLVAGDGAGDGAEGEDVENRAPDGHVPPQRADAFASTAASAYLDLISAARATAKHFGAQLVVLEPRADSDLALPIAPAGTRSGAVPPAAHERKVAVVDALRWMLGEVVLVKPAALEDGMGITVEGETAFTVTVGDEVSQLRRRPCAQSQFAAHPSAPRGQAAWEWVWA